MIMLTALLPASFLLAFQIYSVLKKKKRAVKWIPGGICICFILFSLIFLRDKSLWRLIAVLYGILLLLLCGTGWIIAWSILKSSRNH